MVLAKNGACESNLFSEIVVVNQIGTGLQHLFLQVMAMGHKSEVAVAADLQRQLDELRDIVHHLKTCTDQTESSAQKRQDADEQVVAKHQEEIKKLNVRIVHLLRALESKDQIIKRLQAAP
ncbi:hypothetical protein LPJ64_001943 [Coemansia asiatica]|uniref:Uncharacterized protein n=1 Tax=Coemansia asiatica TaxID=1052880 RepID=A0A9W8CK60_9FUNG|nr:hypothetical protein LPJ64_001943 [Coemansia asiatica]